MTSVTPNANPYDWQGNVIQVQVPRPGVSEMAEALAQGRSIVLLGGRGMGKSVLLKQLQAELSETPGIVVLTIPSPPPELTVRNCLDTLAGALGEPPGTLDSRTLFSAWRAKQTEGTRLVLLFDELDNYAEVGETMSHRPVGRAFFNDLEASRRDLPWLGILAAGSIGIYIFRDVLGSSFLSRAAQKMLRPFESAEVEKLVHPFEERGTPLSEDVLAALQAATGGVAALVVYGLQTLWDETGPIGPREVAEAFTGFAQEHRGYLNDIRHSFAHPRLSQAPQKVWALIRQAQGRIPRRDLVAACEGTNAALRLDLADVLDILQASGMVRVESHSYAVDPIVAHPRASLLNLPETAAAKDFRHQLRDDLRRLLEMLHRSATDFFRPGRGGQRKTLVPESVFAAHLMLGLELLGWRSEREVQSAAGRTDLLLWHNGAPERGVVEVKIWGRNDYREVQKQVESYWTQDVEAGAVVMLSESTTPDWVDVYRMDCLKDSDVEEVNLSKSPIRALLDVTSQTSGGQQARIDHFLIQLPTREA